MAARTCYFCHIISISNICRERLPSRKRELTLGCMEFLSCLVLTTAIGFLDFSSFINDTGVTAIYMFLTSRRPMNVQELEHLFLDAGQSSKSLPISWNLFFDICPTIYIIHYCPYSLIDDILDLLWDTSLEILIVLTHLLQCLEKSYSYLLPVSFTTKYRSTPPSPEVQYLTNYIIFLWIS